MGQSSSTDSKAGEEEQSSGVTLAPELQADIIRDFRTTALQDEWNKFGTSVVQRRNERLQLLQQKAAEHQQARSAAAVVRQQQMASVDEGIDTMQAKFQDLVVELEYDAKQLLAKHSVQLQSDGGGTDDEAHNKDSKPLPCLGQRAHWIDCQKKYAGDARPCNFYVRALETCVQQTISKGIGSMQTPE